VILRGLPAAGSGVEPPRAVLPFVVGVAAKRRVAAELLKHTGSADPVFDSNRARVIAAGEPLLAAAQRAREVRDDVTFEQVLDMFHAIAAIDGDAPYLQPILQAALDGLRPRAS